jgi:hypothetical protein
MAKKIKITESIAEQCVNYIGLYDEPLRSQVIEKMITEQKAALVAYHEILGKPYNVDEWYGPPR